MEVPAGPIAADIAEGSGFAAAPVVVAEAEADSLESVGVVGSGNGDQVADNDSE